MNNEKGISLVEVLGAIAILSIAILGISFVLQQGALHTKDNEKQGDSVQITRSVMETIKNNLPAGSNATVFGQAVNLAALRGSANQSLPTLYYPDSENPQYELHIQTVNHSLGSIDLPVGVDTEGNQINQIHQLADLFRLVRITSTEVVSQKTYTLEAYIEYHS